MSSLCGGTSQLSGLARFPSSRLYRGMSYQRRNARHERGLIETCRQQARDVAERTRERQHRWDVEGVAMRERRKVDMVSMTGRTVVNLLSRVKRVSSRGGVLLPETQRRHRMDKPGE